MDQVKRVVRNVSGFGLLIAGAAMVLLPGPGWVTIALGLALLAPDFPWARNALNRIQSTAHQAADSSRGWYQKIRNRFARHD